MKRLIFILLSVATLLSAHAQKESKDVRAGNKLYEEEKYTEAEVEYRKGLQKNPQSFEANFNLGNALFRQEKYEEALKQYNTAMALSKDDKQKLAAEFHNIGNVLLVNGNIAESIEAYKMALRNNPKDNDTRYNLALAQELLKNQEQQDQDQNQDQENQQEEQQEQEQQQNQDNQQQEQQEQNQQEQEQQNQQQQQEPQMSKENAQQILDALLEDEKDTQEKVKKQKARSSRKVEKDW